MHIWGPGIGRFAITNQVKAKCNRTSPQKIVLLNEKIAENNLIIVKNKYTEFIKQLSQKLKNI